MTEMHSFLQAKQLELPSPAGERTASARGLFELLYQIGQWVETRPLACRRGEAEANALYAEFEWLYDAISEGVVSNRMEWELSLHTAMENLKYSIQVSPHDFEFYDGQGSRRYYSFNSTSYAERAFLKILFPLTM